MQRTMPACWKRLEGLPAGATRRALYFRTGCLMITPKTRRRFTGEGVSARAILTEARGAHGFGYDPCSGCLAECSSAELKARRTRNA